ncbi:hypothetical protein BE04_23505, partial [Sorangium cellulosum]
MRAVRSAPVGFEAAGVDARQAIASLREHAMSGASVSGGSRIARRTGATLALLALLPGCYIDLDGL